MKRVLALLLLAVAGAASAHGKHMECEIHSDYTMKLHGKAFVFTRDTGPARHVAIGGGRLFVDGKEVVLGDEDRARVRRFEGELNALVPETQQVVREATDIAFTALIEVARGFAPESGKSSVAELEQAQRRVRADLAGKPVVIFSDDISKRVIEPVVTEYVPVIAGNAVRSALSVAFSRDSKKADEFERRMDHMGDEIEAKVEHRAEALEPLVDRICGRTRELDRLEQGLALRIDGERLDLLTTTKR